MSEETAVRKGIEPDITRYFIPVELDRERVLAFDNKAAFLLYHRYGEHFFRELFEPDPNAPKPEKGKPARIRLKSQETFEYFLWAGLQKDAREAGEKLTLEEVQGMIVPFTIAELADALFVALQATIQRPRKDAPKNA